MIGAAGRVEGFAFAGALVLAAEDPATARRVVADLPDDVVVAVMTPEVAAAVGDVVQLWRRDRVWTVMPA